MAKLLRNTLPPWLELVERLDIPAIYAHFGVPLQPGGLDRIAFCPFHDDRAHPNLSVRTVDGLYHCFACGASGGLVDFVASAQSNTWSQERPLAPEQVAEATRFFLDWLSSHPEPPAVPQRPRSAPTTPTPPPIPPSEVEEWVRNLHHHHPAVLAYLQHERGLSLEIIHTLQIGFDDATKRITIPVFDASGQVVNVRFYLPHAPKGVAKVYSYGRGYGCNRRMNPQSSTGNV